MDMPLWSIPIGTGIVSSFYFLSPQMNYSQTEWLIGNGLIGLGVLGCYTFIMSKEVLNGFNKTKDR